MMGALFDGLSQFSRSNLHRRIPLHLANTHVIGAVKCAREKPSRAGDSCCFTYCLHDDNCWIVMQLKLGAADDMSEFGDQHLDHYPARSASNPRHGAVQGPVQRRQPVDIRWSLDHLI